MPFAQLARRTAERLGRAFEAQGRPSPWQPTAAGEPDPEPLSLEQPGLFGCYEAAARGISVSGEPAGQPALRLVVGEGLAPGSLPRARADPADPAAPVAEALGISVYAKQVVDGRYRRQLERLCRYITRPPLAPEPAAMTQAAPLTASAALSYAVSPAANQNASSLPCETGSVRRSAFP